MITEHALLPVIAGMEDEFMAAFEQTRPFISATEDFGGLQLSRSIETPNHFLLLVSWASVEAHTVGFRGSGNYRHWKALLHRFYEPFPVVEHFRAVEPATTAPHTVAQGGSDPDTRPPTARTFAKSFRI
ncbi:antibiotic biosynthesis monooxygenase family protein [Paeniglutamicibacter psychrophenolicus]|uniref:antibiotic biosynthesis monooxygenase family protein n=1 Tax=Paeniglutamicibacter psychrophenolicus TaxID=257454 RepID=UPI002780370D|nr:antibiotic biosynthesis monooxygenase [Paeniglutamicibacter psychrophenolicus]MDQ0095902.1 heme-degrading monooxygenase HmoA [Paeniglutamicibacter psychrophenolicus]